MLRRQPLYAAILLCAVSIWGQTESSPPPQSEALMAQLKKTVGFLELTCKEGVTTYQVKGTGFFVSYPDKRLGENFGYFVTNKHVALCWNNAGHPMEVMRIAVRLNLRSPINDNFTQEVVLSEHGNVPWVFPSDESVDLALFQLVPDSKQFDYKAIPTSMFATTDVLKADDIQEGEPVFFTGFFYQFPGFRRIQPIVRQGIIAMMPDERIPFVGQPEHLYLADVHAFGGNSGAPAFINLGGMHGGTVVAGQVYKLLGVVNGEMVEDENFNLELTATMIQGKGQANSGISTMVPADELKTLLGDARLQRERDEYVAQHQKK
jgi:Trypsin-like peptidase domain